MKHAKKEFDLGKHGVGYTPASVVMNTLDTLDSNNSMSVSMDVADTIMSMPPTKVNSQISSNVGFLSSKKAYLILESPIEVRPSNFAYIHGNKLNGYVNLGDLNGFAVIEKFRFDTAGGLPKGITADEIEQIYTLLKNGVIL